MDILLTPILIFFIVLPVLLAAWLYPAIHINKSCRTEGNEKLLWVFMAIFFSWLALLVYFLLSPIITKATTAHPNQ